jgi:hypothetical protein
LKDLLVVRQATIDESGVVVNQEFSKPLLEVSQIDHYFITSNKMILVKNKKKQ